MAEERSDAFYAILVVATFIIVLLIGGIFLVRQYWANNPDLFQNNNQQEILSPDSADNWNSVQNGGLGLKYPNNFFDPGHEPKIFTGICSSQDCGAVGETVGGVLGISGWQNPSGERVTINNTSYLLCQSSDAAAGHTYNYYYYLTVKNQQCLAINFATSQARCENYLPLQPGNTEQEKNYNNCITKNSAQPAILQQIINTFTSNGV